MRAQLIILISVVLAALIPLAMAGTGTITISGNSTANATSTVTGVNTVVTISAWNTGNGIKTFKVNVTNASDDLTFYLNNFTGLKVNEFKLNSTPQNGYQANSTGVITFTYTQTTGNATYNLQPAVNQGGFNYTWGWFTNLIASTSRFSTEIVGDITNGSTATSVGASNKFAVAQSVSKLHNRSNQLTAFFGTNDSTNPLGVSIGVNGSTSSDNSRWSYIDSSEISLAGRPLVLQAVSGNKVVVGDGSLNINPLTQLQVMGLTSSTGTAIVADANGNFYLLTSSEAGKRNISIVGDTINWSKLQEVPIKQYEYTTNNLTKEQSSSVGFTVESLYDAGLYELINFDDEGKPFSIKYDALAAYQQGQINNLSLKITALERRIATTGK